jgi:hypothetical protein
MKIEVKKIKHARSLSEETNAFTAALYVDGEHVADCKNSGQGGQTDIYPKYDTNTEKRQHYREVILKAEAFCKTLPKYEGNLSMSLDFYIDLEIEKDLRKSDINRVIKNVDKACLKSIVVISKKKLDDFLAGKTLELPQKMYGWKRPIADIPVEVIKAQLPAIKAKLIGDEIIYNKNLPK